MSIGKKIKQYRQQRGLTQAELGNRLGITKSAVCNVETDKETNLSIDRVFAFADALGCEPSDVLENHTIYIKDFSAESSYKDDMQILLEYYNTLDTGQKERVLEYARLLSGDRKNDDTKEK